MQDTSVYQFNTDAHVFVRSDCPGIDYSDGGEIEQSLLRKLRGVEDVSTSSEQLTPLMDDWPSEYHFSRKRHLVLKPFDIQPGESVLELGCGCGAITRYLGERGADVTAVEGALARASVAAERTRDLANVKVYIDDLQNVELRGKFDWVLLIGVLEYSPRYSRNRDNPVQSYLEIARQYLKEQGRLVVAIENRLGLKYFNSASEDHLGRHFYGIEDLYRDDEPATWGRGELDRFLEQAGFVSRTFYGAFPDYKLPEVIVSESGASHGQFDAGELLFFTRSHDYGGWDYRLFDEGLAAQSLSRNGLLLDLANSFILEARLSEPPLRLPEDTALAYCYNAARRSPYCTETVFRESPEGVRVSKIPLFPERCNGHKADIDLDGVRKLSVSIELAGNPEPYLEGELGAVGMARCERRRDAAGLARSWGSWIRHLLGHYPLYRQTGDSLEEIEITRGVPLAELYIAPECFDLGPKNIKRLDSDPAGFDFEWRLSGPVPLGWVLYRSILQTRRPQFITGRDRGREKILEVLSAELGSDLSWDDLKRWRDAERQLQASVSLPEPTACRKLQAGVLDCLRLSSAASGIERLSKRNRWR